MLRLKRILPSILLASICSLAAVGCGAGGAGTAGSPPAVTATGQQAAQQVTLTAKDNLFEPKSLQVEAGKPIRLTVVNAGQNVHEVEVKDLMPETTLAPGQSRVVDIPAQTAGTHKIYCEIHEDQGMEGEFVVR